MDILRNSLPAGLTVWHIANENIDYQQRADYVITAPQFERSMETARVQATSTETRKERIPNMLQQLAAHVEDLYLSYTPSMKKATEGYLKQKLLEFVMSDSGNTVLGPKRCREVVSYIGTAMLDRSEPFFILCSFLLDAKVTVGHQVYTWNHQTYANEVVMNCKA